MFVTWNQTSYFILIMTCENAFQVVKYITVVHKNTLNSIPDKWSLCMCLHTHAEPAHYFNSNISTRDISGG